MQLLANEACDSEQDLETKALEIRRHRRLLQQQMIRKLCAVCGLTFSLLSGRGGSRVQGVLRHVQLDFRVQIGG